MFFTAAQRGMAGVAMVGGLVVLASACGNKGPAPAIDAGPAVTATATASVAACAPGTHADVNGTCVADDAGAAEVASAEPSAPARPPSRCPEVTNPDRVVAFDWSKELSVDAPLAARLRGASGSAVETRLLSSQIAGELRAACASMAAELGNKGVFPNTQVACQAAVDALKATRKKLGPSAKVAVHVHAPICPEGTEDERQCAQKCAGEDKLPDASCAGAVAGRCPGACTGACEMRAPATCDGACMGACEGGFSGTCDGTCKGKCNGKELKPSGECKGKCEGSCEAVGKGECKGKCIGGCQLHGSMCAGLCAGTCSVPMQDTRCLGAVKLAGVSPECSAYCEMRALHRGACSTPQVDVRVSGTKEPAATSYAGAIERHLPAVLKTVHKLKGRGEALTRAKSAVADSVKAVTAGGDAALPTLAPCLSGYDKAAAEGVTSLFEDLRAATDVLNTAKAK
ncbi:keratin associated protein [Minicystis rosea]|nr:keratin associated protein [Minicystis rosea]